MKFKDIRQQVLIKQQNKVDGIVSLNNYQFDQVRVRNKLAHMDHQKGGKNLKKMHINCVFNAPKS